MPSRNDFLNHVVAGKTLARKSAFGAVSVFSSQCLTFIANILSLAVLARFLDPSEFGLVGMVTAISGFSLIFTDLGLSAATVQRPSLTHEEVSNLFWINAIMGLLIMVCLCAAAPLIALLYGEPRLISIVFVLSIAFFLGGLATQHRALLRRRMNFGQLAIIHASSATSAHIVAILLAWTGAGVWALVAQQVSLPFFTLLGCFLALPWIPSLPHRGTSVTGLVSFGVDIAGFGVFNYFSRNLDKVLIGRSFGAMQLGFYSKAYDLLLLPLSRVRGPLTGVAIPALSGLQGEAVSYARYFRLFVSILAGVSFPFVALLIIFADSLILLMLGKGWAPSVVLFHRLGWAALAQPLGQALGVLLITSGLSRRYLLWGAMHSAIMVASFFIGLPWGPNGIATSYAIANYIVFFPSLIFCTHGTYVSATLILRSISLPALATAVAACWVLFTKTILPLENQFLQLGVYASMFAVVYILPYFFFQSSRAELASFFKLGKRVFLCRE